jgi:hypothetical protein
MATAGALQNLSEVMTIDGQKLSAINAKDSTFGANLGKNLINNMASATMNSALTGAKLEDSLKTALTSAVISAGAGQAAFAIGGLTVPGTDGKPPVLNAAGQALAHALAGCMAGAAGSGSQGCQSGAIGAVVGELAAQWVNPTGDPTKATQTIEVVKVLSAAAGALTGDGSAQSVNTAVMTGVNAAENNWLATRQKAQLVTELNAANNALDKAKVLGKYALISGKQDVLTVAGVGKGLAESGWSDIQGMAEFLSDPAKGLQGLQQVITDPQTRAALGDQIVGEFTAKIDRMNKALEVGGDANAVQLGQDLGSLVWQVGSVVTGVAGTAKAGAMLASAGVKMADAGLDVMRTAANLIKADAKGLGGVVNAADVGMEFGKGIMGQGKPFEGFVQTKLPEGTLDLNSIKSNFSTFDHLTPDGVAVSTKTLDTSAVTYQKPSKITYQLNQYVDQMVSFPGDGRGDQIFQNASFTGKQMQLGIPSSASADQMAAIAQSVQYAQSKGISIVVTKVK